ncbi:carbohydrate ABC transporter substrate-binding protein (CUT1 family) [Desmospora activa DSM 45169]|uniref:Carbohydrate ABC transporter substrate-binding protein (CUT1 family) n=2 Tax=Desmospora TaxID=500614 RepID=A0A2T4ZCA7_9BACL|nr:ABC transporter substrate-binding protein [Desmospora activa]PTM59509.1 carbohydrate ABC transporter substrate-binding protein (CUT1 family) [Desmospora activa DSM 45169]
MVWKKRREFALLSAVFLLVAGCTNDKADDATGELDPDNPITFSAFFADPNPAWNKMEDDVGQAITKRTGVKLNAEFAVGNPDEKIALIAASGDYPDLISPKGAAELLVDSNAMVDLEPLIEKHAPNIKKMIGDDMGRLRYSNDDPSIYFIPTINTVEHTPFDAEGTFNLQHAVVKELGYPEIRTVKDFENAIKKYMEKHPTINGQKTIGLSLLGDDWRFLISVSNPGFKTTGGSDDGEFYIDPQTYEATLHYRRPEEKEYFRWLNHMNDIGLLDPESFVQSYDQYKSKIASGRVLALIDAQWQYQDGEKALKKAGKQERTYGHYHVTLSEKYKDPAFQDNGFLGGWGIGITKSCKDPVRAIKFLDWMASEEGQILNYWGVEGKHYEYDEDGKRVIPKEVQERRNNDAANFDRESGIGSYHISLRYGDGVKDSTDNYITTKHPDQIVNDYSDIEKEVLAAYGAKTWKDLFPQADEFPVKPWGAAWDISIPNESKLKVQEQRAKDIVYKRIPEAILADPDNFDKVWDQFMKDLDKIGVEEMEAEYTKLVKQRVKLWSE